MSVFHFDSEIIYGKYEYERELSSSQRVKQSLFNSELGRPSMSVFLFDSEIIYGEIRIRTVKEGQAQLNFNLNWEDLVFK